MINFRKFKFKRFLKLDIRWKLKRIEKLLGINLYPKYFEFNGIKNFYSYIVFNLIFFEQIFKKKKVVFQRIKKISENNNKKVNFIYCLPSSGSNYVRNFLSSYFELKYKIGNGIPKFDNYSDNRWFYSDSPVIWPDLFSNVFLEQYQPNNEWSFYNKEEFLKERVGMSRYPLKGIDLFKIEDTKPLILLREPYDWFSSIYVRRFKGEFYKDFSQNNINEKLIQDTILRFKKFTNFWKKFLTNQENQNFLIIKFENLVESNKEIFLKILKFFNLEIDNEKVDRSIYINSKEFIMSNMQAEFKGTRFADVNDKNRKKELLKDILKNEFEKNNILENYNQLLNLQNK